MTPGAIQLERLRESLVRAVASACPGWPAADREDVVHNVLAHVLSLAKSGEWNPPPNPSYLRKMAFHAAVDEIRRRRVVTVALEEALAVSGGHDPEAAATGLQLGRAVADCLAAALRDRRAAVVLSLQGHAAREVAELMGWTAKKAENLIFRGMNDLRHCLAAKGYSR